MKIRKGFVSNSSSSSFVLYGIEMTINDLEKVIRKYLMIPEENIKEGFEFTNTKIDALSYCINEEEYFNVKYKDGDTAISLSDKENVAFGFEITNGGENLCEETVSINGKNEDLKKVCNFLGKDYEIKIFTGTC